MARVNRCEAEGCENLYMAKRRGQRFCFKECASASRPKARLDVARVCHNEECKQEYFPSYPNQTFCGLYCANRVNELRNVLLAQVNAARHLEPHEYEATGAVPGSKEKVEVLRGRVERGEPLYHPHDATTYECCRSTQDPIQKRRELKLGRHWGRAS